MTVTVVDADSCAAVMSDEVPAVEEASTKEFMTTAKNGKISQLACLCGLNRITMKECCVVRERALIRADLAYVFIGSYCIVGVQSIIRPHWKRFKGAITFFPVKIGSFVNIGSNVHIESTSIGNYVTIGENSILGKRSVVKSCVVIEPDSVIPPDTTLPSFTRWGGDPARCTGYLHEGAIHDIKQICKISFSSIILSDTAATHVPPQSPS
eukprot:TRINITY_DN38054_c0_g1_i1.p1 TRINITY_DN38054_c0_g1~~TRINITY_DN38054_c0_g1_i1.p1  ORF type:complete len:210 (+),score=5.72 TRINITY_DN38054_c0_g1_i1:100-729(+)